MELHLSYVNISIWQHLTGGKTSNLWHIYLLTLKSKGTSKLPDWPTVYWEMSDLPASEGWRYIHTCAEQTRVEAGRKLASTQIITCVHTYAVAERRRSGSKIRSATNESDTQFSASASKPCAPNHRCPQEMADPPASAPLKCEHTCGSRAGMAKSARLRSATTPHICEHSLRLGPALSL